MKKIAVFLFLAASITLLPFQAAPVHAQDLVDSFSDMLEDLFGGNDEAEDIGESVEDIVSQGEDIGEQFEDIGDQFSEMF